MILRALIALAIVVLRPVAAWADTIDVAALLKDGGPWGMVSVCCAVIAALWLKLGSKEETITALQNKRGDEADARAERFAKIAEGSATSATNAAEAVKDMGHEVGELREAVKLQTVGTDALLKGQDGINGRVEGVQKGVNKLLGDRA